MQVLPDHAVLASRPRVEALRVNGLWLIAIAFEGEQLLDVGVQVWQLAVGTPTLRSQRAAFVIRIRHSKQTRRSTCIAAAIHFAPY